MGGPQTSRKTVLLKWGLLLASVVIGLALAEGALRLFFAKSLYLFHDERTLLCRHDTTLGWFPLAGHKAAGYGSRLFFIEQNQDGFRGPEPVKDGRPVMAFLGDSFTWGYDVNASERFTDKLQAQHPEWNLVNLAVSGYGTDQEYLLLQQEFETYHPRIVFLMFCTETDEKDNCSNFRYGGYYKPYYTVENNQLVLHGVPVPRSERAVLAEHPVLARSYVMRVLIRGYCKLTRPRAIQNPSPTKALLRALQAYVKSKGAVFLVGITWQNPPLEQYLKELGIPYVDVSTRQRFPSHGNHWTPEGHSFVCDRVEEFLSQRGYLRVGSVKTLER